MKWERKHIHEMLEPAGWGYRVTKDSAYYTYEEEGQPTRQIHATIPALQRMLDGRPRDTDVAALVRRVVDSLKTFWQGAHIKLDQVAEDEVRVYWSVTMTGEGAENAVAARNRVVKIEEALTDEDAT